MGKQLETVKKYFDSRTTCDVNDSLKIFTRDAEIYNVNFPPFRGVEGIRNFCENFAARTSHRQFEILDVLEKGNTVMAEWKAKLKYRAGARVGDLELAEPFEAELAGINKFEFEEGTNLIKLLRIYHETTTVSQLAQKHAKK